MHILISGLKISLEIVVLVSPSELLEVSANCDVFGFLVDVLVSFGVIVDESIVVDTVDFFSTADAYVMFGFDLADAVAAVLNLIFFLL